MRRPAAAVVAGTDGGASCRARPNEPQGASVAVCRAGKRNNNMQVAREVSVRPNGDEA
jgi:hypothetical protein